MSECEFCHSPITGRKRFCDQNCQRAKSEGQYAPPVVPLSKRYPDPVWGGLRSLWEKGDG